MTVEEAKGICKDRCKWKEVISAYPRGKRCHILYVCHHHHQPINVPTAEAQAFLMGYT
jgi:hypothetical protein